MEAIRKAMNGVQRPPAGPFFNGARMCLTPGLESIVEFFTYIRTPLTRCRTSIRLGGVKTRRSTSSRKWMCLDQIKKDSCLVVAFGAESSTIFENDIEHLFDCKVYMFDPSITHKDFAHTSNIHFLDVGVADYTGTMMIGWRFYPVDRYVNLLRTLGLENSLLDYLKIDIDGAELRFLRDIFTTTPQLLKNIKQIGMMIHLGEYEGESIKSLDVFHDLWKYFKLLECYGFTLMFSNQNSIPSQHYALNVRKQAKSYELVWVQNHYY